MAEILIEKLEVATDYYEILDVGRRATDKEIKVSYRKKALLLHPDRCQLPKAKDAFQKLSNAYMCLSDEQKRRRYDVSGSDVDTPNPFAGGGAQNPFTGGFPGGGGGGIPPEIFEQLFGAAARGGGGGMPAFHFSTTDGFSGFSFNQPRHRGRQRAGAQQQQRQGRQPAATPTELPARIRNSWMYRAWTSLQDVAPPAVLQMVTFSLIMLLFIVGVSLLARHFWFFVFFSIMRTFGGSCVRALSRFSCCLTLVISWSMHGTIARATSPVSCYSWFMGDCDACFQEEYTV
eukprot:INCI9404.2.p1 GENE.INCI9404.2~~INCI9404.2.p1  ORF type:complete len:289 (-),score=55.95 INCI9404.2:880-1746(-)